MNKLIGGLILIVLFAVTAQKAYSTAPLNGCNNATGECRAKLVTVYSQSNLAYAVLEGHLKPATCTGATWGYYWSIDLSDTGGKTRYSMLLSAYMAGDVVEIRTNDSTCGIIAVGVGE